MTRFPSKRSTSHTRRTEVQTIEIDQKEAQTIEQKESFDIGYFMKQD